MNEIVGWREIGPPGGNHELEYRNIGEKSAKPRADVSAVADTAIGFKEIDNACDVMWQEQEAAVSASDVDTESYAREVSLMEWRPVRSIDMKSEPAASRNVEG
jgi:hypothetical protein